MGYDVGLWRCLRANETLSRRFRREQTRPARPNSRLHALGARNDGAPSVIVQRRPWPCLLTAPAFRLSPPTLNLLA
jgi:hypothetical protein